MNNRREWSSLNHLLLCNGINETVTKTIQYVWSMQVKWPSGEEARFWSVQLDPLGLWLADKISCLVCPITKWIQLNRSKARLLVGRPFNLHRSNIVYIHISGKVIIPFSFLYLTLNNIIVVYIKVFIWVIKMYIYACNSLLIRWCFILTLIVLHIVPALL